ncbi:hypothetical protein MNBD_BACTEROID03-122 [hydrothermal vent metagenome]|uniref:Uncharacterized protein n=1 Tax=hydrothermal vent metagenome TaxID=652676 RepID=A0A3B0TYP3_9ZZZZ
MILDYVILDYVILDYVILDYVILDYVILDYVKINSLIEKKNWGRPWAGQKAPLVIMTY